MVLQAHAVRLPSHALAPVLQGTGCHYSVRACSGTTDWPRVLRDMGSSGSLRASLPLGRSAISDLQESPLAQSLEGGLADPARFPRETRYFKLSLMAVGAWACLGPTVALVFSSQRADMSVFQSPGEGEKASCWPWCLLAGTCMVKWLQQEGGPEQWPHLCPLAEVALGSPSAGVNESPLMTWGEVENTPLRVEGSETPYVDRTPGPAFKVSHGEGTMSGTPSGPVVF